MREQHQITGITIEADSVCVKGPDFDCLCAMAKDCENMHAEVQRLQRALAFWLPLVPADDSEIEDRAGDDAMLLVGFDGPMHPCAEELGWIKLRPPTSTGSQS